jgi:opacity protein-like surface antigen
MVNGLVDFGDEAGLSGFVGGGVGAAKVKFSDLTIDRKVPFLEAEGTVFAGELLTGARLPVTDNVELDLKYRYFLTSQISKVNLTGNLQRAGFQSHSILAGLTYNFGGPPTPPPPPPPPPPPSAAPAENPNPTAPVM